MEGKPDLSEKVLQRSEREITTSSPLKRSSLTLSDSSGLPNFKQVVFQDVSSFILCNVDQHLFHKRLEVLTNRDAEKC